MKSLLNTYIVSTTATVAFALALVGCGALSGLDLNGDGIPDETQTENVEGLPGSETPEAGKDGCPEGTGKCLAGIEILDDMNNPTLAPTCDKGPPKSPGADIDGAVLADSDGVVFATLANCSWKKQPTSCENDHADMSAAEGNVTLLDDARPTNMYDPRSRKSNFAPAETDSGDYLALNGGSIQCEWVDIDSGEPTYAKPSDFIWVYEVGGGNGTKTEQFGLRVCQEKGGACDKELGLGSGVSFIQVRDLMTTATN